MYRYILCAAICAIIWIINGRHIAQSAREHISGEVYSHTGLGIFFSVLTIELTLGETNLWAHAGILWLWVIGAFLYIPSGLLVIGSAIQLKRKGKTGVGSALAPHGTTVVVDTGVFGVVRHPMWLGMAIWSVALMMMFQSIPSVGLGIAATVCFRVGAVQEDRFNLEKFGDAYREYAETVPLWNAFRRFRK